MQWFLANRRHLWTCNLLAGVCSVPWLWHRGPWRFLVEVVAWKLRRLRKRRGRRRRKRGLIGRGRSRIIRTLLLLERRCGVVELRVRRLLEVGRRPLRIVLRRVCRCAEGALSGGIEGRGTRVRRPKRHIHVIRLDNAGQCFGKLPLSHLKVAFTTAKKQVK